jgi:hypothetical protein
MMFDIFQQSFLPDAEKVISDGQPPSPFPDIKGLSELLDKFGGLSFRHALYRVVQGSDLDEWKKRIALPFPEYAKRITCFGYDWLGRVFAVDTGRLEEAQPGVVMFEPGTGEVLEIPCNLETFHENGLKEFDEAALAIAFHDKWLTHGGTEPGYGQCIGYKKPLFLGGLDEIENLEVSDIDVYWHISGQLIAKVRGL